MRNGKSPTDVMGAFEAVEAVEERIKGFAPTSVAFMLTVTGGVVARYRRLHKENDRGAVSIEAAIIMAVLIAAAVAIAGVVLVMWNKYQTSLENSDNNWKEPGRSTTP